MSSLSLSLLFFSSFLSSLTLECRLRTQHLILVIALYVGRSRRLVAESAQSSGLIGCFSARVSIKDLYVLFVGLFVGSGADHERAGLLSAQASLRETVKSIRLARIHR